MSALRQKAKGTGTLTFAQSVLPGSLIVLCIAANDETTDISFFKTLVTNETFWGDLHTNYPSLSSIGQANILYLPSTTGGWTQIVSGNPGSPDMWAYEIVGNQFTIDRTDSNVGTSDLTAIGSGLFLAGGSADSGNLGSFCINLCAVGAFPGSTAQSATVPGWTLDDIVHGNAPAFLEVYPSNVTETGAFALNQLSPWAVVEASFDIPAFSSALADPYVDDFNRADGSLTTPWVQAGPVDVVISNEKITSATLGTDSHAYLDNSGFSVDQFAELEYDSTNGEVGVVVRASGTGGSYQAYEARIEKAQSPAALKIVQYNGNNSPTILSHVTPSAPSVGKLRLEVKGQLTGTALAVYINNQKVGQVVPPIPIDTGNPGVGGSGGSSSPPPPSGGGSFSGGSLPNTDGLTFGGIMDNPTTMTAGRGTQVAAFAAGTATDQVVKASSGRLCRVLVTTQGSAELDIYDNASGHTGILIGVVPASAAVGTVYDFGMPAANGITVKGASNTPGVTISFE